MKNVSYGISFAIIILFCSNALCLARLFSDSIPSFSENKRGRLGYNLCSIEAIDEDKHMSSTDILYLSKSFGSRIKSGNQLYKSRKFDDALKEYSDALLKSPDSEIINYNIGTVLYKKGNYQEAIESFVRALTTENTDLEARASYNIGNCKYRLGELKEDVDLSAAISLFKESLDYYKRAIELNAKDNDARYNYEFVERRLKSLLNKSRQQSASCNKAEYQKPKESRKDNNGNLAAGQQEQGDNTLEQQKKTNNTETELGLRQKDDITNLQSRREKTTEMSEEEALMLLEGYRQQEIMRDRIKDKGDIRYHPEVLKDW